MNKGYHSNLKKKKYLSINLIYLIYKIFNIFFFIKYMINKIICVLLLILFSILVYLVIIEIRKSKNKNNIENFKLFSTDNKSIEHFEDDVDQWGDTKEQIDSKTQGLNKTQRKECDNMIKVKVNDEIKKNMANQQLNSSSVPGEQGPSGPPGGEYIAGGVFINKKYSYDSNNNLSMSVSRSHGEDDSGKAFLEINDKFSPSYYWYLYKDGTLRNRYDNNCLTTNGKINSDLYMSPCTNSSNQNWFWDNKSNRFVLQETVRGNSKQKCIKLSSPKIDENTLLAGCSNNNCGSKNKRYLKLGECSNSVQLDEVWSFT